MTEKRDIELTVNGQRYAGRVEPRLNLGDFLRHELGLTGTHIGCEHGVCGACTVIVDGSPVRSCLMLAVQADRAVVETVEGLARNGEMHPLQKAFTKHHALQCGFCTPGVMMSLAAYLRRNPNADEMSLKAAISGNICRCTGYEAILDAAIEAAREMRKGG
jgi:aerobic-type carbon monoxide dehydrogenase small subunit (CoxS/CutS family)